MTVFLGTLWSSIKELKAPFMFDGNTELLCIQSTAGKCDLLLSQGILVSIPLEAANPGSLSHTYCCWKLPFAVLVENWHTSSVEARESALILSQYGVHRAFLNLLC